MICFTDTIGKSKRNIYFSNMKYFNCHEKCWSHTCLWMLSQIPSQASYSPGISILVISEHSKSKVQTWLEYCIELEGILKNNLHYCGEFISTEATCRRSQGRGMLSPKNMEELDRFTYRWGLHIIPAKKTLWNLWCLCSNELHNFNFLNDSSHSANPILLPGPEKLLRQNIAELPSYPSV